MADRSGSATRENGSGSSARSVIAARSTTFAGVRGTRPSESGPGTLFYRVDSDFTKDLTVGDNSLSFSDRLQESFSQLYQYIPALIGALVILFAGYLLARLFEKGTERLLRRIRFNQLLERGGVMDAVERAGSHMNPTRIASNLVFWFIMFTVMLVAANALGLQSLANVFSELVSYIPSVIAAIVIIIVGSVLGGFVGGLIMASAGGLHGGPTLARVGKGGVIVLAVFMALQELGVASEIVTTAFALLFGAVALALALSFGLGNRELAAEITREWWNRYRAERDAIERDQAQLDLEDEAEANGYRGPTH